MAATRGQRERTAAHVPPVPREVDVRAGIEQQRDDREAAAATDRVVQATVRVDIDAAGEEPGQAGGVLEVELVVDHALEAGRVEHVEQRGVRLLAGVVERVLVRARIALEQQPDEREVAAFHRVEQRGHAALAVPLDRVTVRVGAGVEEQPHAVADVGGGTGRAAQHDEQRRQPAELGGRRRRVGLQEAGEHRRVGEHERALHAVQPALPHVADAPRPAV